jgi:prepilin-type N-terminal cleavage/methylation domain-containing protein
MNKAIQKGFTLIELLVVITIIGILATGAVTTFTSQIQKARDTTRITDIKALQSAIEQVYQDQTEYPQANEFVTDLTDYMERLPQDPKHAQPCNANTAAGGSTTTDCGYAYISTPDANGILYGEYEVSTAFENT